MALKDSKGKYHRITGIFIQHGNIEVRIAKSYNEAERTESPEDDNYYNQSGVVLPDELKDEIYTKIYDLLKTHKIKIGENVTTEVLDEETGEIITEKEITDIFEFPFAELEDC